MKLNRLFAIIVLPVYLLITLPALGAGTVYSSGGKAIEGYDPVAYFNEQKAVEGNSRFTINWRGANWQFANADNRDKFKAQPEKYAPQYGGYCAWAVSQGYTASTDPDAWKIVDGKLYLNYSKSVQARWSQNIPTNITASEANWPGLKKGLDSAQ